jgi:hypothetical protein
MNRPTLLAAFLTLSKKPMFTYSEILFSEISVIMMNMILKQ